MIKEKDKTELDTYEKLQQEQRELDESYKQSLKNREERVNKEEVK